MGLCASKAVTEDEPKNHVNHESVKISVNSPEQSGVAAIDLKKIDENEARTNDWKDAIKGVTLIVCDRLAHVIEGEKILCIELAHKRKLDSYVQLMAARSFVSAFRDILDVQTWKEEYVDTMVKFKKFINAAQASQYKPNLSRSLIAEKLQGAAKESQQQLLDAAQMCTHADLKSSLSFLAHSFDYLEGDIAGDVNKLFKNLEEMTSDS